MLDCNARAGLGDSRKYTHPMLVELLVKGRGWEEHLIGNGSSNLVRHTAASCQYILMLDREARSQLVGEFCLSSTQAGGLVSGGRRKWLEAVYVVAEMGQSQGWDGWLWPVVASPTVDCSEPRQPVNNGQRLRYRPEGLIHTSPWEATVETWENIVS